MTKKCYIVKVYIDAEDLDAAGMKVAKALLGRGESWQIIQSETIATPDGLSPQMRMLKQQCFGLGKFVSTITETKGGLN